MEVQDRNLAGAVAYGEFPIKSYKKTILGRVYVTVWNSLENLPEGLILQGDPNKNEDGCIVDIYTPAEERYFTSKNKVHLQTGTVIEYLRKNEVVERTIEQFNDDELSALLEEKFKKFFSLQTLINGTESIPVLFRIKKYAQDHDKSEKTIKLIEARISEVQAQEFKSTPTSIVTEL